MIQRVFQNSIYSPFLKAEDKLIKLIRETPKIQEHFHLYLQMNKSPHLEDANQQLRSKYGETRSLKGQILR